MVKIKLLSLKTYGNKIQCLLDGEEVVHGMSIESETKEIVVYN